MEDRSRFRAWNPVETAALAYAKEFFAKSHPEPTPWDIQFFEGGARWLWQRINHIAGSKPRYMDLAIAELLLEIEQLLFEGKPNEEIK